ncbi:primosomal protein n : Primosomal protein N OS=Isosphaera pallida (strain ATCC 43644 / DSM 9630 / IS1B) GN=Isop_2695 PE=4 SV=1: DEAD: Helicase_C [Gemmata massiliana]|uniref:Replication restart protein PriA n=1 Tax=Gemmata massiliana TaxID=1210884 RepID=A0A6P2CZL4_9BACT|nr:primosomal protein N' [Gemmata massiliana]VTR92660.1 primosomal protein n : Primosomal protein N OS=Isosphaera pallida (strain ATCC 43644 / DSM 9630 / IS1B) GN=Isop_2695 PE=4 SV=1: DEAD: Helicase_C [Gemmata massiliana]
MTAPNTLFEVENERELPKPVSVPATLFADIVFDRPLDHAYTYAVPESLVAKIGVGKRVEVPFGKGGKGTAGFCVRVTDVQPTSSYEIKSVARVLDDDAIVDEHLMKLTRWMADYYLCGWGQVLHAVVPAGVRDNAGTRVASFVEPLPKEKLPNPLPTVTPQQKAALDKLKKENRPLEVLQLARLAKCTTGVVAGLIKKGLVRKFSERIETPAGTPDTDTEDQSTTAPLAEIVLNADQLRVWEPLRNALETGGYHPFLLHGVTGSGKTEVYLRAIEEVVKQGKEVIVLVPEISLTPQTISRFKGRCGNLAVLHSHLTDAERGGYWRRVATGHIQVVVGARSAVFAPTRKLGLIVIDEEHENSFKQESTPRYHARDVAVMRARLEGIPILMGSATPSLESWANAERGNYAVLSMPNRVASRPLPAVKLVDLRHEPKTPGKHYAIGPTLESAMRKTLKEKGQIILLLNRRGFSTHVHCEACGHVAQCAHCDLAMTFHRTKNSLMCHYCGFETAPFQKCPACSQPAMRYQGLGTEKLQVEIEEKFPGNVCQRMDSDTMSKPGSHQRVLDAFRDGLIQILVGTQMIAKGLDFPNVTLVGVVNADVGLHLPDFRSAERTFQLLAQVAGRAGRGEKGGQVLVQTFTPDHPCITLASHHNYGEFAKLELVHRKQHKYPPYERLARLIVRSEKEEAAATFADALAGTFKEAMKRATTAQGQAPVRLLGPAECPVFRLNNFYRFHFQIQSDSSAVLHEVLRNVLTLAKPPSGVEFQVDIDPYSML